MLICFINYKLKNRNVKLKIINLYKHQREDINSFHLFSSGINFFRFSNSFKESFSANSTDLMKMVKGESIVCPEQTKQTDNCTTCALCWDCPAKKILFITH